MATADKQTVASNTNAAASQTADGNGAQNTTTTDALDELLATYEEQTNNDTVITPPKTTGDGTSRSQPNDDRINNLEQRLQSYELRDQRAAMDQLVTDIRGDTPAHITNGMIKFWAADLATQDPRLDKAFNERFTNPQKWNAVKAELGKKLQKWANNQPDSNATEDRNAVAAAVKGASNKLPAEPAPDFSSMSNADFEKAKRAMFKK